MTPYVTEDLDQAPERIMHRGASASLLTAGVGAAATGSLAIADAASQATPVASDLTAINAGETFSGAIVANGFVFTSGMLAIDPTTDTLTGDDITTQTQQVLENFEATLTAAGSSMDRVVKATCFLANFEYFPAFNEAYRRVFSGILPARSTVEVADLALGALVEIELIALA